MKKKDVNSIKKTDEQFNEELVGFGKEEQKENKESAKSNDSGNCGVCEGCI